MARGRAPVPSTSRSSRPVVLLVDDDADTLEMYEIGLSGAGFLAVGTRDAASVGLQVDAVHPDIVVTDLQLHGTTGWNVMQCLKKNGGTKAIPVVLLTGYSNAEIDRQAHDLGCAAVLTKPCTPDELGVVIRRVLAAPA
jgi:CheY-like chemotaxis protein